MIPIKKLKENIYSLEKFEVIWCHSMFWMHLIAWALNNIALHFINVSENFLYI